MPDMKEKTLKQFYESSDETIADFMREAIEHYFEMRLDNNPIGITALETFKDASLMIAIQGDTDD